MTAIAPATRCALGIVGTESCGKSALARGLGAFFDCPVLDDPLRIIAGERPDQLPLGIDYDIAVGRAQILEDAAGRAGSRAVVVSDATALMARVWSERFIDAAHHPVVQSAELERHNLWLLLSPTCPSTARPRATIPPAAPGPRSACVPSSRASAGPWSRCAPSVGLEVLVSPRNVRQVHRLWWR